MRWLRLASSRSSAMAQRSAQAHRIPRIADPREPELFRQTRVGDGEKTVLGGGEDTTMARVVRFIAAALIWMIVGLAPAQAKVTVSIACSSLGVELELCQEGVNAWAKQTGNAV